MCLEIDRHARLLRHPHAALEQRDAGRDAARAHVGLDVEVQCAELAAEINRSLQVIDCLREKNPLDCETSTGQGPRDQGYSCRIDHDVLMPSNPASLIIARLCSMERSILSRWRRSIAQSDCTLCFDTMPSPSFCPAQILMKMVSPSTLTS